ARGRLNLHVLQWGAGQEERAEIRAESGGRKRRERGSARQMSREESANARAGRQNSASRFHAPARPLRRLVLSMAVVTRGAGDGQLHQGPAGALVVALVRGGERGL